jgi:hypothetical protein
MHLSAETLNELRAAKAAAESLNDILSRAAAMPSVEAAIVREIEADPSPANIARYSEHLAESECVGRLAAAIVSRRIDNQKATAARLKATMAEPLRVEHARLNVELAASRAADIDLAVSNGFPAGTESTRSKELVAELGRIEAAQLRLERGEAKSVEHFMAALGVPI